MGGLCLATYKRLSKQHKLIFSSQNILTVSNENIGIIVSYFAPDTNIYSITNELGKVLSLCRDLTSIVLGGDFNCRLDKPNLQRQILLQNMRTYGLICINREQVPTSICHNGTSVIDLIFIYGVRLPISSIQKIESNTTKHQKMTCKVPYESTERSKKVKYRRKIDKNSLNSANEILNNSTFLYEYNEMLTIVIWRSAVVPTERKSKQWFDRECYSLYKKPRISDTLAKKARQKKFFKRMCQNKRREHEHVYKSRIVAEAEIDTQKFWKILKSKIKLAENSQVQNNE